MQAAYHSHTEIARILIEAGADVNTRMDGGSTALMAAVLEKGNVEMVCMLIDAGADVNLRAEYDARTLNFAQH